MGKDLFLDTVAAIYDATLQPGAWPVALSRIRDLAGGTWPIMAAIRGTGETDFIAQDAEGNNDHLTFFRENYNSPDTNPSIPSMIASTQGTIILREQYMSDTEWDRCGLYREVYRPADLYHGLGVLVLKSDAHIIVLGVNRPKAMGEFASRELGLLGQILPHIRRAMQVFLRLADLQSHRPHISRCGKCWRLASSFSIARGKCCGPTARLQRFWRVPMDWPSRTSACSLRNHQKTRACNR